MRYFFTLLVSFNLISTFCYSQNIRAALILQEGNPYSTNIELVGGDPEFVVRCLQSDFGMGQFSEYPKDSIYKYGHDPVYVTEYNWSNINNKNWSAFKCNLSIKYTIEDHPSYSYFGTIPLISIECKDANGKNLLLSNSKSREIIISYLKEKLFYSFAYVNSSNGLYVRKEPSLSAPIVYQLKNKNRVIIKGTTKDSVMVKRGNTIVKSIWKKIYIDKNISGYVVDAFLIPWDAIHPDDLYVSEYFSYTDSLNGTSYGIQRKEDVKDIEYDFNIKNGWQDTLNKYFTLELVDERKIANRKIKNKYTLVNEPNAVSASPIPGFKLPIRNGLDSILIQDEDAEYDRNRSYYGKLPLYNKYLVSLDAFDHSYELYDVETGEREEIRGFPFISPNGKYRVELIHNLEPEYYEAENSGSIIISYFDPDFKIIQIVSLELLKWIPSETINSAFWISDNELIIFASNNNALFSPYTISDSNKIKHHSNCIKLTIK